MTVIIPSEGRRRDLPMTEGAQVAAAAAGSAADFTTQVCVLPDLTLTDLPNNLREFAQNDLPINASRVRQALWVNNLANRLTASAANYYDWQLRLYRKGVLQGMLAYYSEQVTTTVAAAITVIGVQAVTPAAMTGIVPGLGLYIDSAGTPELVYVISTTAATFTANFTLTHSASFAVNTGALQNFPIVMVPAKAINGTLPAIASTGSQAVTPNAVNGILGMYGIHVGDNLMVDYGVSGKQEVVAVTAVSPTQFTATFANTHSASAVVQTAGNALNPGASVNAYNQGAGDAFVIKGGDTLVLARVSSNATGLASDPGLFQIDWVPAYVAR